MIDFIDGWYPTYSKRVIQSVPTELSADHISVLKLLEVCSMSLLACYLRMMHLHKLVIVAWVGVMLGEKRN